MLVLRPLLLTWLETVLRGLVFVLLGTVLDAIVSGAPVGVTLAWGLLALVVATGVASALAVSGQGRAQAGEERSWHGRVLDTIFRLGTAASPEWRTGRVVSTATDAVERTAAYRATFLGGMVAALSAPILVLLLMGLLVDPVSAWLLLIPVPLAPIIIGGFQSVFRSVSSRYRAASRRLAGEFLESIQGLATLRLLGASARAGRRLAEASEAVRRRVMALLAGNQLVILVGDAVFSVGFTMLALALVVHRLSTGAISPGQGLSVFLLSLLLLDPLERIGAFFYVGMGGIAAKKEIGRFSAIAETTRSSFSEASAETTEPVPPASPTSGEVRLEDVSFRYASDTLEVLADANLTIAPGERVGVVGRSGAGKSTVLDLVQGILRPTAGRVVVSGRDLGSVDPRWAHSQATVVPQRATLFTGTLRDNLRIADPGTGDDRCWWALEQAGLAEIHDWEGGLDTLVGERGMAVSGGQAQRIAIARALLRDAPVVLLDEPTSQIDLAGEKVVLAALDHLTTGRTVLTVTHRPAALRGADRVVVLTAGRFEEVRR